MSSELPSASVAPLRGSLRVPGDKSLSHRVVLFSAMAEGCSAVSGLSTALDVQSSLRAVAGLGAQLQLTENKAALSGTIIGWGARGPRLSPTPRAGLCESCLGDRPGSIDCGNSGTTARLLMGVLAGWPGATVLTGDASLSKRPMLRVSEPLSQMGARFSVGQTLPLTLYGSEQLQAINYQSPVASAQVKSAVLIAALRARGCTTISEPALSRNHTELLLPAYGARLQCDGLTTRLTGPQQLRAATLDVPGDPSSAAFLLVAAALVAQSEVSIQGLLLNPTRSGFLAVMRRMGADISIKEDSSWRLGQESVGEVTLRYAPQLRATTITPAEVPSLIDELPILALLATVAVGTTVFQGVGELRVKESDRLAAIVSGLTALGCRAWAEGDNLLVEQGKPHCSTALAVHGDHRLAMTWAVAEVAFGLNLKLDDRAAVAVSYPSFFADLESLRA